MNKEELVAENQKLRGELISIKNYLRRIRKLAEIDVLEGKGGYNTSTIYNFAEEALNDE